MTWGEVQLAAIKKMFLTNDVLEDTDLPAMKENRKYRTYLDAMPEAANEALLRIMTVSRPLIKEYSMSYNLDDTTYDALNFDTHAITDDDYIVECDAAHSYYFELDNTAVVKIESYNETTEEWDEEDEIDHTATIAKTYETYKGLITNASDKNIRLRFVANEYFYNVRNIALYTLKFRTADEVFNCTPRQEYNLKTLISDFYKISSVEYESLDNTKGKFTSEYVIQGDNTLLIDSSIRGNFKIKYEAYPDKIQTTTLDSYVFTMADEMIALLPLYLVSETYKDDDIAIATQYRNQFELGLQEVVVMDEPLDFQDNKGYL